MYVSKGYEPVLGVVYTGLLEYDQINKLFMEYKEGRERWKNISSEDMFLFAQFSQRTIGFYIEDGFQSGLENGRVIDLLKDAYVPLKKGERYILFVKKADNMGGIKKNEEYYVHQCMVVPMSQSFSKDGYYFIEKPNDIKNLLEQNQ